MSAAVLMAGGVLPAFAYLALGQKPATSATAQSALERDAWKVLIFWQVSCILLPNAYKNVLRVWFVAGSVALPAALVFGLMYFVRSQQQQHDNIAVVLQHPQAVELATSSIASDSVVDVQNVVDETEQMTRQLVEQLQKQEWQQIVDSSVNKMKLWKHPTEAYKFKLQGLLDAQVGTVFDFLTDTPSRQNWDDLVQESRILHTYNEYKRVIYIRMRSIWPVQSRDMVLLSLLCKLDNFKLEGEIEPCTVYVNVTRSVEWTGMSDRREESITRMQSPLSGQILRPSRDGGTEVLQLIHGDPGGWIPSSAVAFVTSNAIPRSFAKLNKLTLALPQRMEAQSLSGCPSVDFARTVTARCARELAAEVSQNASSKESTMEPVSLNVIEPVDRRDRVAAIQRVAERAVPWLVLALVGVQLVKLAVQYKNK